MKKFWEKMWQRMESKELDSIIRLDIECIFIDYFKKYNIKRVCDAGCGFGQYSIILALNGFEISGFDISNSAIELTENILGKMGLTHKEYVEEDICNLSFEENMFEGMIVRSVLNYLKVAEAKRALDEISRTVEMGGLIYISFDGINNQNLSIEHDVLDDGSLKYNEGNRSGMIWRFYTNEEIRILLSDYNIIHFTISKNGAREVVIVNQKKN
jgi:2-polyprenyl-3-methyl-5-hydroxy-6-metoxy-1,4-benzoquinol methylase